MWTHWMGIGVLCLLVLGSTAVHNADPKSENQHEELTDFYNLLDVVDDSSLGEIENIVDVEIDDADVTDPDPDVMLVDPPALMEEDLRAVELNDEDDEDDEVMTGEARNPHQRNGRRQFWKKAKKWAKRLERGGKQSDRRRGWWRDAEHSDTKIWPKEHGPKPADLGWIIQTEGRKVGKVIRAKIAKAQLGETSQTKSKRGPHHKHPQKHHGWVHMVPLEKRVAMICLKLEKPANQLYIQLVHQKHAAGLGNLPRKAYRMQFVDRMMDCCKDNVTREQCFITLSHERYDNFCDNEMPLKPWAPSGPKHKSKAIMMSTLCCEHASEERYNCFNGTGHAPPQAESKTSRRPVNTLDSKVAIEDDDEDDDDEYDDDDDDHVEVGRRGGRRRKHGRRGHDGLPPSSELKVKCCHAGRKGSDHIRGAKGARARCMAAGRKFSMHRKEFKHACGAVFGRCCTHTLRRSNSEDDSLGAKLMRYDASDEDVEMDEAEVVHPLVVEEEDVLSEMVLPPEVVRRPGNGKKGQHHKGKKNHKHHQEMGVKDRMFY